MLAGIHETDAAFDGVVLESFIAETNVGPPGVTGDCGAG